MNSSQQGGSKHVAPLKIVEHYEVFKKALKNGDVFKAQESLKELRKYQGGERLAAELQRDLEVFQLQLDYEQEYGEQSKDLDEAKEFRAQKILTHLELCETFLGDSRFSEAQAEILQIKNLGDENLALKLQEQLEILQKKQVELHTGHEDQNQSFRIYCEVLDIATESFDRAQEYFVKNELLLLTRDKSKLEDFFKKEEKARYDAIIQEFYEALEQGRTTFARNLIGRAVLPEKTKDDLFEILEKKKKDDTEEKRLMRVSEIRHELQSFLDEKDFTSAKKVITKLKRFATVSELDEAKSVLEKVLSADKQEIEDELYAAIVENINEEDFLMAKRNLKDFKKLKSSKRYEELEALLSEHELRVKKKRKTVRRQDTETKKQIAEIFNKAQIALFERNFEEAKKRGEQLVALGDEGVAAFVFEHIKLAQAEQFQSLQGEEQKEWKKKFDALLKGDDSIDPIILFEEAQDIFNEKQLSEFKKKLQVSREMQDLDIALAENDFNLARKIIRKFSQSKIEKERHLLRVLQEEKQAETEKRQSDIRHIHNAIERLVACNEFEKALEEAKSFVQIGEAELFDEVRFMIQEEIRRSKIREIQKNIDVFLLQENTEAALKEAEKIKDIRQEEDFAKEKLRIQEVAIRLKKHKQEALIAHIAESIQQGNFAVYEQKKTQLPKEDFIYLEELYQQKRDEIQEQKRKEKWAKLDEEFSYVQEVSSADMQKVFEKMQLILSESELKKYAEAIQSKKIEELSTAVQETSTAVRRMLRFENFKDARNAVQKLLKMGAVEESNHLLSTIIHHEKESEVHIRTDAFESFFAELKESKNTDNFEEFLTTLKSGEEFFKDPFFASQMKEVEAMLEEIIIVSIEEKKFDFVNNLLVFVKKINVVTAGKLERMLRERENIYYGGKNLVGAKDYIQKQSVLLQYQAWKKRYELGQDGKDFILTIKKLGEKDFAKALESFVLQNIPSKETFSLMSQTSDFNLLEAYLRDNFFALDFSALHILISHFEELYIKHQEQSFFIAESHFEEKLIKALKDKDFNKAKNLFSSESLSKIRQEKAELFAKEYSEAQESFKRQKKEEREKQFISYLESEEWEKARNLLVNCEAHEVVIFFSRLQKAEEESAFLQLKEQWSVYKEDMMASLQNGDFEKAWKDFEMSEEKIPLDISLQEREELVHAFLKAFDEYVQKLKLGVHTALETDKVSEAQILIQKLEEYQNQYQEKLTLFERKEAVFQEVVTQIIHLLQQQDIAKAEQSFLSARPLLTERQQHYILSMLEENKSLQQNDLAIENQIESLLKNESFSEARTLLLSSNVSKNLVENLLISIKNAEAGTEVRVNKEEFKTLLEKQQFAKADELLLEMQSDLSSFIEAFYVSEQAKQTYFQNDLQEKIRLALKQVSNIATSEIQNTLKTLEESFIDQLLLYGQGLSLKSLEDIFMTVTQNHHLFGQDTIYELLVTQDFKKAEKAVKEISYTRLNMFFHKKLQLAKYEAQHKAEFINIQKAKEALSYEKLDEARNVLVKVSAWGSLNILESTFVLLLEKEARLAELERRSNVQTLKKDIEVSIKGKRFNQAQKLLEKIRRYALHNELEELEKIYDEKFSQYQKEQEEELIRSEKQREENIKKYELFVLEALKTYNFLEAGKFIQEIQNLGEEIKTKELRERLEEAKFVYEKQEKISSLIARISHAISSYNIDQAKKLIQELEREDPQKALEMMKQLKEIQGKDKNEVIEQRVQELLKEHKYDEAEALLENM